MQDKRKIIEKLVESLREDTPDARLGLGRVPDTLYMPTPFVTLNNLNNGGIPYGKFGVIAGASQTSKSTLLAQIMGYNMQINPDFYGHWLDLEESVDNAWFEKQGVDMDRLIVQRPDAKSATMEDMLEDALKIIGSKMINLSVIDSIGALLTAAEGKKTLAEATMLELQRKLGIFFRKATPIMAQRGDWPGCAIVMIGQVYNVPTTTGVGLEEVRGGNAVKHYAHWRWKTRRGNRDEGPGEVEVRLPDGRMDKIRPGWAMHIKQDKTKLNDKEGQGVILQFINGRGLDSTNASITALIGNEIIKRNGAMYLHDKLPDGKIRGRDSLIKFLQDNKEVRDELVKEMDTILAQRQVEIVPNEDKSN